MVSETWSEVVTVPIRFEVTVPPSSPNDDCIFLAGNEEAFGAWNPAGIPLERVADRLYAAEIPLIRDTLAFFKVTRGTWETVELDAQGFDLPNRELSVDGMRTVRITVERWAEGSGKARPPSADEHVVELGWFGKRTIGEDCRVLVHVPPGYDPNARTPYPILYMLDGRNVFDASTAFMGEEWAADETHDALLAAGRIRPFFIVSLDHPRRREKFYTPVPYADGTGGDLHKLFSFVKEEVRPALDARWRISTAPRETGIIGSSLGGLAAFHLGWRHPDYFGLVAAMSPSLWWMGFHTYRLVSADRAPVRPLRVWMDMGTMESMFPGRLVLEVRRVTGILQAKGYDVYPYIDEGGHHTERSWRRRLPKVFEYLYGIDPPVPQNGGRRRGN